MLRGRARVGRALLLTRRVRDLARRASAEFVGTALLVAIVVGSGIAAQRLSPGNTGLQLIENSIATGAGLVALILAIGPVSGAHFNPVVTLADRLLGGIRSADARGVRRRAGRGCMRRRDRRRTSCSSCRPSPSRRTTARAAAHWLAEFVATFGLLIVILGVVRAGRANTAAFAVGGYIAAAYWFTSSTSFANPAVTIGRTLTDTFAGIDPGSAPAFIVFQVLGAGAAVALAHFWNPTHRRGRSGRAPRARTRDGGSRPHDRQPDRRAEHRPPQRGRDGSPRSSREPSARRRSSAS